MTKEEFFSGVEFKHKADNEVTYRLYEDTHGPYIERKSHTDYAWRYFCNLENENTRAAHAAHGFSFILGKRYKFIFVFNDCIPVAAKKENAPMFVDLRVWEEDAKIKI